MARKGKEKDSALMGERKRFAGPDPYGAYHFKVEIDGLTVARFQEVSGLTFETEVFPFQEGGLNDRVHQLMGQSKTSSLILKRGLVDSNVLWDWRQMVLTSRAKARRHGAVILLDGVGGDKRRWNFYRAWPSKWEGPQLNAGASQLSVETVEIAYERLELA